MNAHTTQRTFVSLEEEHHGKVVFHAVDPYVETSNQYFNNVLKALIEKAPYVDSHGGNTKATPNPFTTYALFKSGSYVQICPVSNTHYTSLNPVKLIDGEIVLDTFSIGGAVLKTQLDDLTKEGYLVGWFELI